MWHSLRLLPGLCPVCRLCEHHGRYIGVGALVAWCFPASSTCSRYCPSPGHKWKPSFADFSLQISSCFTLAGVCNATGASRVPFRDVFGKLGLWRTDLEATLPCEVCVCLCQSARFLFCVPQKCQKMSTSV